MYRWRWLDVINGKAIIFNRLMFINMETALDYDRYTGIHGVDRYRYKMRDDSSLFLAD